MNRGQWGLGFIASVVGGTLPDKLSLEGLVEKDRTLFLGETRIKLSVEEMGEDPHPM